MAVGQLGRNNKPTAMKAAEGNPGGKRVRADEPKPSLIVSTQPPKDFLFSPLAIKIWKRMAEHLRKAKMLGETDVLSLAAFCNAAAEFFTADKDVAELVQKGHWASMGGGKGRAFSPLVSFRNQAAEQFKYWSAQFGMSPAAVAKLIAINTQMDVFEELLDEEELQRSVTETAARLGVVVDFPQGGERLQ